MQLEIKNLCRAGIGKDCVSTWAHLVLSISFLSVCLGANCSDYMESEFRAERLNEAGDL